MIKAILSGSTVLILAAATISALPAVAAAMTTSVIVLSVVK